MHASLLREHIRKEKMRTLSLRMLMNRLSYKPTSETLELISALRLQLVWCKICENLAMKMMPEAEEEEEEASLTLSEQISEDTLIPPAMKPVPLSLSPTQLAQKQSRSKMLH